MTALELTDRPKSPWAWANRMATALLAVVVAAMIAGCATTEYVPEEEEEEVPEPVQEEKVEAPPPEPEPEPEPEPPPPLELAPVYFEYDKAELRRSAREALKLVVDQMLAKPESKVNVEGHCDERGTDEYNVDLGWKRAYAVRDYLKRLGIDEARIFPISFGRARPAVVGHDESAWQKNRRVELAERE